ncbi:MULTISPECIES: hypothetical protein [unclassified Streptomyces]|uniref:hypothetical protein n=1 Tax=unclassified Streptomyces TaxID=2593676 RepID=UPI0033B87C41
MTAVNLLAAALLMAWAIFLAWWALGPFRIRRPRPVSRRRRPSYAEGLEQLREAIEEARREMKPGGPSPDLDACRDIWPDAPHSPKEWS